MSRAIFYTNHNRKYKYFLSFTWYRGRPTMDGNTALGASSPANPALHIPEPLSTTRAATSSSHMISVLFSRNKNKNKNKTYCRLRRRWRDERRKIYGKNTAVFPTKKKKTIFSNKFLPFKN